MLFVQSMMLGKRVEKLYSVPNGQPIFHFSVFYRKDSNSFRAVVILTFMEWL